jgi:hypothetical protein
VVPQYAAIDTAVLGNTTLVAAVSGRKIRVVGFIIVADGTVSITFQSGAGGTALTGAMPMAANTHIHGGHNSAGWFETAEGALLNLNLSAAVGVRGALVYIIV